MRVKQAVILMWCAASLGQTAAAAPFDDLEFQPVWTDPADALGFADMRELAIAEPGNGTLLVRIQVADFTDPVGTGGEVWLQLLTQAGESDVWTSRQLRFDSHGESALAPIPCRPEGNAAYCWVPYELYELAVGKGLTSIKGYSYSNAPANPLVLQDCAPDPNPHGCILGTDFQPEYVVLGCTRVRGCPLQLDPSRPFTEVRDQVLDIDTYFGAPRTAQYDYNWSVATPDLDLTLDVDRTGGAIAVTMTDGNGTDVVAQIDSMSQHKPQRLSGAPGEWHVRVLAQHFKGRIHIHAEPHNEPAAAQAHSSAAAPWALVAVLLVVLAARRR
ncbi:MAG: hypothetical protein V4510_07200 [bacterium]